MFLCLLMAAATATAAPPIDVTVGTRVPLDLGVRGRVELPGRVQVGFGVGYLPGGYVDVINSAAQAFNAYDDATASVIRSAIKSSLVTSIDAGWRPIEKRGLRFGVGYSFVALGGDAAASDLVAAASGSEPPSEGEGGRRGGDALSYDLAASLHLVRPEVGWTFLFGDRWVLDAGLGGLFTMSSAATVEPEFTPSAPAAQTAFTKATEVWLVETLDRYVHSPTVSVAVGMRFGG